MITKRAPADTLRSAGLRATQPRIAMLGKLGTARSPLSADELHRSLGRSGMDRVTVYRTLESFKRVGIVREIDLKRGYALFELRDEHDHHHLVCVSCGKTEDFTGCNIDSLAKRALRNSSSFTSISEHSLELFGVCVTCTR